jgi:hypothetical protein
MDEKQKADLTADARISEITLRWTMTQLFFLIHSALFSLVLTQFESGTWLYTGVCILGLWLGILWFVIMRRAQYLVEDWNKKLAELERMDDQPVKVFITEQGGVPSPQGVPVYKVLILLVGTFVMVWIILLTISMIRPLF